MAYTKTNWTNGDLITASKLNKMEQGIADGASGGVMVITETYNPEAGTGTLSATWQEINDSIASDAVPFVKNVEGDTVRLSLVDFVEIADNLYSVYVNERQYKADTPSDYPVFTEG